MEFDPYRTVSGNDFQDAYAGFLAGTVSIDDLFESWLYLTMRSGCTEADKPRFLVWVADTERFAKYVRSLAPARK